MGEEQWAKTRKTEPVGSMIGFYIIEGDEPGNRADLKQGLEAQNVLLCPEFLPVDEVSVSVDLPNPGHPYLIVPCTFSPGKEGQFLLEVPCESSFQLDRLRKPEPTDETRRDSLV